MTWNEAPWWAKAWFVLGVCALVGGVTWDRVAVQREADAFLAAFPAECARWKSPGPPDDRRAFCRCMEDGIRDQFGDGRVLARQTRYWAGEEYVAMAVRYGCDRRGPT